MENTVKGPKDAFVETVRSNTSLIRRHLRTPALRLWETQVGRRSLTNVTVAYIDGLTDLRLVERMQHRLEKIDVDGFLAPSAVEEYVTGSRKTAFPLIQYTERADKFCAGLLEGRVGLLVDGLPLGYLAPADLGYLMESPEDWSRGLPQRLLPADFALWGADSGAAAAGAIYRLGGVSSGDDPLAPAAGHR